MIIIMIILIIACFYFWCDRNKWRCKYEEDVKRIFNKELWVIDKEINSDVPLTEKLFFVDAQDIVIEYDDKYFYESVEKYRDFYEKVLYDAQIFKAMLQSGKSIRDIKQMEEYRESANICFNIETAVIGEMINDKIYLSNGRHRSVIAKEVELEVPIYISSKRRTYKIGDIVNGDNCIRL